MKFPRLVYKSASEHILVENEAEHAAALKAGWHDSVPDALGQKAPVPVSTPKAEDLSAKVAATPAIAHSAPTKGKKTAAAPASGKNPWD